MRIGYRSRVLFSGPACGARELQPRAPQAGSLNGARDLRSMRSLSPCLPFRTGETTPRRIGILGGMHGVTTALVAFLLACVIWPHLVKNRPQYYAAFGMVCGIILFDALAAMIPQVSFDAFAYVMCALLQIGGILMFFMSAGGISARELAADMSRAYEVIRRGEEEKEVIIPRTGEVPRPRSSYDEENEEAQRRIELNSPDLPPPAAPAKPAEEKKDSSSIPLE